MHEKDINRERLELALEAAGMDLWENDLQTGEVTRRVTKIFSELGYDNLESLAYMDDLFSIVHPEDVDKIKAAIGDHLSGVAHQYRCEFRLRKKDGSWVWYANYGKVVDRSTDSPGRRFIGVTFNIDDRKRIENELAETVIKLEEKELAKSRFLAAAGHDLRQPLAAANLFIDALKLTEINNEQNPIVQHLEQAMMNFNVLLETLLNVSKLEASIVRPEYTKVKLAEIFNWLEQTFAQLCNEKHLRFKLHFPHGGSIALYTDIGLLKSVLMNLVSNAIKFTHSGGILVSARPRGSSILFQVWDTGTGIQDEYLDKIFDDFYQINNPQRDRTQGLGLGLSIAKRTLALLDSKISCRSQFGQGSVFEFILPLESMSDDEKHEENSIEPMEINSMRQFIGGRRFVIVEDDAMVSEALASLLTIMGGKVEKYYDAETALHTANIEQADCYIVDYMLPGNIDGMNFLTSVHQKRHKPTCAVMMSGDTTSQFIHKAEFFDWPVLHKPVNLLRLISQLNEQYSKNN